jgi:DNA primase
MSRHQSPGEIKEYWPISRVISDFVVLKGDGSKYMGLCPFHDDKNPSMSVNDDEGYFHCFACGAAGDHFGFLQRYHGVGFVTALESFDCEPSTPYRHLNRKPARSADKQKWVDTIWEHSSPIQSCSPVGDYLASRGIPVGELLPLTNLAQTVLQYQRDGEEHPVLLAAIRNAEDQIAGVQRIYLTRDGKKLPVASPKMSLGTVRGGAIKLGDGREELIICEGLEDALSIRFHNRARAVWAAAGGNMMPSMPIPDECRLLIIAQDNDRAGHAAARAAIAAFKRPGREIRIMKPSPEYKDFNDELQASAVV